MPAWLYEIESGVFSPEDPHRFAPILQALSYNDHFLVGPDFRGRHIYAAPSALVGRRLGALADVVARTGSSTTAPASAGSPSDRTISEYAAEIWGAPSRL